MILAYLIHGPERIAIDGIRLVSFILAFVLIGQMLRYARNLWNYTEAVDYDSRGFRDYMHRWTEHNKRLLGRIWLCISWVFFIAIATGTSAKHWGCDMGYWRLPCIILGLSTSTIALHYLIRWNNLTKD